MNKLFFLWSVFVPSRRQALGLALSAASMAGACGGDAQLARSDREITDEDEPDDERPVKDGDGDADETERDAGPKAGADGGRSRTDAGSRLPAEQSLWCKAKAVLEARCTSCHDGAGTAGTQMGLVTFADTQAPAPSARTRKVYELIGTRIHDERRPMPPANDMSAAEKSALDAWIADGAAAGADESCDGEAAPAPPVAAAWPKECTEQYRYKIVAHDPADKGQPLRIPRGQETHPQVAVDAPWGTEAVQALAMRPITDNRKVLHHWILYASSGAFITGWAPGKNDRDPLPDDVGMFLPSGPRSMRLDMHYYNREGAGDETDMSGVEICAVPRALFRKNTATVFMGFNSFGQGFVLAPANTRGHESTGTCRVTARQPVHLLTASPHAHTYARAMRFTVTKADGTRIVMHEGPFNFEEQTAYPLKQEVILSTGDTVTTTCVYDNDTNRNVTFGENTGNEMCFNFAVYYPMGALSCSGGFLGLGGF